MENIDKLSFQIGSLIGSQLNLQRDEPWVLQITDTSIKILRNFSVEVDNPLLEVE